MEVGHQLQSSHKISLFKTSSVQNSMTYSVHKPNFRMGQKAMTFCQTHSYYLHFLLVLVFFLRCSAQTSGPIGLDETF